MQVDEAVEHLQRVNLDDSFIFDAPVFQQVCQATTLAKFFKDVDLVAVNLDTVVLCDVGMTEHLHDIHLILDLVKEGRMRSNVLKADLLDGH